MLTFNEALLNDVVDTIHAVLNRTYPETNFTVFLEEQDTVLVIELTVSNRPPSSFELDLESFAVMEDLDSALDNELEFLLDGFFLSQIIK